MSIKFEFMKTFAFAFICVGLASGCATRDLNPETARAGLGYVDIFSQPKMEAWWKVDVFDAANQSYKEFTAQFNAPEQDIFRVEARPGRYKARITFVNQAVEAPAEVDVEVRAGMITPIQITAVEGGSSYVRVVEDRAGGPALRNKVTDQPQRLLRLSALVQSLSPYAPKQSMNYWK